MTELLHFIIGCLFAFLLQLCWYWFKSRNTKTDRVTYADYDNGNRVLTVEWNNGEATQFSGNGNVWYHLPMMRRCDTYMETELTNLWRYCTKWNAPYPDGHIKYHEIKNDHRSLES